MNAWEKTRLGAEIIRLYGRAWWGLRQDDLPTVLARLRLERADVAVAPNATEKRSIGRILGSITTRLLATLPTDGRCLIRSLVLTGLLSRRGIESTLVIAVYPGHKLAAHAWVEYEGAALLEPGKPPLERLAEL
jgi:hypothetical protein